MGEYNDSEEHGSDSVRESGKHRSKDKSKSTSRRDDKDCRSRDQERSKEKGKENKDLAKDRLSSRDRRKEEREERDKYPVREKHKEKERDKELKDRVNDREKEMGEKSRDKDKERDRAKDKEREKHKDRERENGRDRGKDALEREKGKERNREIEKHSDQEKGMSRDRDRTSRKHEDGSQSHYEIKDKEEFAKEVKDKPDNENLVTESHQSALELEGHISKMREERMKKSSSEGATEVLSWVNRSRKLEEKRNSEKEKALQLSRIFQEQDNMNDGDSDDDDDDDDAAVKHTAKDLGGVKILHGLDKVLEGGAVVLTLKDQSILADGDINEEVDMLENVEIGEQKRRDMAYKAGKKKTGVYDDKFNVEPGVEKKMLPQYDDPVADEGVTLDSSGRFTGEAERKLEELRKRIQGVSAIRHSEDLNSFVKISTDYLTQEEMVKFKKPKKKKWLRKKEKLDIDALEAEAVSTGLGAVDLGSRSKGRRQNLKEEQDRIDAEKRSNAYQSAYAKADEASKALLQELTRTVQAEEDDTPVFGDDDDELRKSLERVRKIALQKQNEEEKSSITLLATSTADDSTVDNSNYGSAEQQDNKVVFTEMEEFVWGLQNDEETHKPDSEDVFMDEDMAPIVADQEMKDEDGGWAAVKETVKADAPKKKEEEEEVVPDGQIHESAVGKGLAATLKLLKDRGSLKETVEWGGRNMDKKKSKLVGLSDGDGKKEIRIERTDEYGRILTPKEAFRLLSHKFHGKGPGKMKQEKRMRQYHEELKVKQMKNADTPSLSVQRMREAQATLQTPYLVLSGNVKTGQSSDPRSGFATVEKDLVGRLTPMLGDAKVEHFLNIKRKSAPEDNASQKKPKT